MVALPITRVELNPVSPYYHGLVSGGLVTGSSKFIHDVGHWAGSGQPTPIEATSVIDGVVSRQGRSCQLNAGAHDEGQCWLTNQRVKEWIDDEATGFTYSVLVRFNGTATADEDSIGGRWSGVLNSLGNDEKRWLFRFDSLNDELDCFSQIAAGTQSLTVSAPTVGDGAWHWVSYRWDYATMSIHVDGKELATGASAGPLITATSAAFVELLGGHNTTSAVLTDSPRFDFKAWGLWDRALPSGLMRELRMPNWSMFRPVGRTRRLYRKRPGTIGRFRGFGGLRMAGPRMG